MHRADGVAVLGRRDVHARPHDVVERRARLGQRRRNDLEAPPRLRPASSGQRPPGTTGPVPDTRTRSPTRTARLKPMVGSKGEPDEMR